jgi:hypothetical protein
MKATKAKRKQPKRNEGKNKSTRCVVNKALTLKRTSQGRGAEGAIGGGGRTLGHHHRLQHSGNIHSTFREHAVNIQGTFNQHSWNMQSTFREHSVNIHGTCSQHSGNIQSTFMEHAVNIQGTFTQH